MNARIRDKQAAYLAAMGREPEADPRGANVVELSPAGVAESDEVAVTYDKPRRVVRVRGKTTRVIVADICRELGRAPAQLVATPTQQGDFFSAWIKANDGPQDGCVAEPGQRLAFVAGISPTQINIVLGHPIPRVEPIPGEQRNFVRFVPIGSGQAQAARAEAAGQVAAQASDAPAADPIPEPETSGDDE